MNYIFLLMSGICLLFFCSNTGYTQANKASEIIQGPFKTDLFPGGEIFLKMVNKILMNAILLILF